MTHITIELDEPMSAALGDLAERYGRPVPALVGEALEAWLDVQSGHLDEILAGLAEAERGEFVSRQEIQRIVDGADHDR